MAIKLGKAFVEVVPSFVGFPGAVERGVAQAVKSPGQVKFDADTKPMSSKFTSTLGGLLKRKAEVKADLDADGLTRGVNVTTQVIDKRFAATFRRVSKQASNELNTGPIKSMQVAFRDPRVIEAAGVSGTNMGKRVVSMFKRETDKMDEALGDSLGKAGGGKGGGKGGGILGTIGTGALLGTGMGVVTGLASSLSGYVGEAMAASDATDKFKSTLTFAGLKTTTIDALTKSTQSYADKTVYDLADIQNVTAQLAANHVKDYDKMAEAMGNLNAVAGGNKETFKSVAMAATQTAGAGKLTTENWNQIADAIPGASGLLQEAMKKNGAYTGEFRDAMAEGQISSEEFNKALMQLGNTDAAKKAATSTKTIEGAWGNFQATITGGLAQIITAIKPAITVGLDWASKLIGPVFGGISKGIEGVIGWGDRLKSSDLWAGLTMSDEDAKAVGEPLDGMVAKGQALRRGFQAVGGWFRDGFLPGMRGVFDTLGGFWVKAAQLGGQFATDLMAKIRPMMPQIRATFNGAAEAVQAALGLMRAIVGTATNAIGYIWRRWGGAIVSFASSTFSNVIRFGGGFFKSLTGIFKLLTSVLKGDWSGAWRAIKQIASGGWQMLKSVFSQGWLVLTAGWNAGGALLKRGFDVTWKGIRGISKAGWDWIKSKTLDPMVRFFKTDIPNAARDAKAGFSKHWDGIKKKASEPVKKIIDVVWNDGIVALAGKAGLDKVFKRVNFKGFKTGGFTGSGSDDEVAGPAHRNEFVFDARTVRAAGGPARFETMRQIIRSGRWPVGGVGEVPGDDQQHPAPLSKAIGPGVPPSLRAIIAKGPKDGDEGIGGPVDWALGQLGRSGWYRRCLAFVNAAWGHSVARLGMATARQSMNAGPLAQGVPPAGAAAYYNTSGYAGHVALSMGDGSVLSNDIVVPGRIDRVPYNIFASKWGAPYMGYFMPGGGAPGKLSQAWAWAKGGVAAITNKLGQTWDQFKDKIGAFANTKLPGAEPWLGSVKSIPGKLAGVAKEKLKGAWDSTFGAAADVAGGIATKLAGGPATMLGKKMAENRGWTGGEWDALHKLWTKESGWNPFAKNKSSGAYGIPQALPGNKMRSAGWDWRTNAATQIKWGLGYIAERWGSPSAAWAHSQRTNWYDNGGYLPTGRTAVMNGTGKVEPVFTAPQWAAIDKLAGAGLQTLTAGVGAVGAGSGTMEAGRASQDRFELTITNWEQGTGMVRRVAAGEARDEYDWRIS